MGTNQNICSEYQDNLNLFHRRIWMVITFFFIPKSLIEHHTLLPPDKPGVLKKFNETKKYSALKRTVHKYWTRVSDSYIIQVFFSMKFNKICDKIFSRDANGILIRKSKPRKPSGLTFMHVCDNLYIAFRYNISYIRIIEKYFYAQISNI